MTMRPLTLAHVIQAINDDAGNANSPDLSITESTSVLASVQEDVKMSDTSIPPVLAVFAQPAWGTGNVGAVIW